MGSVHTIHEAPSEFSFVNVERKLNSKIFKGRDLPVRPGLYFGNGCMVQQGQAIGDGFKVRTTKLAR